ncbi:hypothetical protein K3T49_14120 [Paenibacillus sonchi]|nr:hypothetical protein [Paenibacillus sonchi]
MMKKKVGLLSMVLLFMHLMITACGWEEKELSLGVTESGSYTNEYFGVSLNFPTKWIYQNPDQMNKLMDESMEHVDYALRDNENKEIVKNMSRANTLSLLVVSKFPLDAGDAGPSIVALAEKLNVNQGVHDGKDYLEAFIRTNEKNEFPYTFEDITTVQIGGKNMDMLKGSVDYGNAIVTTQEIYSRIIDEYAFCFIVTYTNDESKAETDKILESVSFQ